MDDIPAQYFQSVITIEIAVTGALLWNIRFFDRSTDDAGSRPRPWQLLLVATVLGATLFGCLYSIRHGGSALAASAVAAGLALSMIPILLRVLPPVRTRTTTAPERGATVTLVALALYLAVVAAVVVILHG